MTDFVDFPRLREQLKMADVIAFIGLTVWDANKDTPDGDHFRANCPACKSKNALFITLSAGKYFCHSDQRGGDAIGIAAHVRGCGQREAGLLLQQELLDKKPKAADPPKTAEKPKATKSGRKRTRATRSATKSADTSHISDDGDHDVIAYLEHIGW